MSTTIYKPTWLYIKLHPVKNLLYFGKTVRKDPAKYEGSGIVWRAHCEKYGRKHETIWCEKFETRDELSEFALFFSDFMGIVESKEWANLIPENGLGGASCPLSEKSKAKISRSTKGRIFSEETKTKLSISGTGKKMSDEMKAKMRAINLGKKMSDETKAKISAANQNRRPYSAEIIEKMAASQRGKTLSEEHKKKLSESGKVAQSLRRQRERDLALSSTI